MKRLFSLLVICMALASVSAQSISTHQSYRGQRDPRLEQMLRQRELLQQQRESAQDETTALEAVGQGVNPPQSPLMAQLNEPTFYSDPNANLNLAVILPFNLASRSAQDDKMQMRSVEFYQGLLLAVNRAQQEGVHITIQTYDLGTRDLEDILTDPTLLQAQTIIAPMESQHVEQVALFGESHGIPVLSPFSFCRDLADSCTYLYQLPTPKSSLYDRLSETVLDKFDNYEIVFVSDTLFMEQKDAFPAYLEAVCDSVGRPYHHYVYNEPYTVMRMDSAMDLQNHHVLYIMETPQRDALRRFFPSLKNKLFLDANPHMANYIGARYANHNNSVTSAVTIEEDLPEGMEADSVQYVTEARKVAILGYPEWQLYINDFMEYFYDLNVWMFTKFYINPFDPETAAFYNDFKYWYNREPMPLSPKYALLGYDVATYILDHLKRYGSLSSDDADGDARTLQSSIFFEQQEQGCYINRGFYLVHFTPETTIEKYEIK